MMRVVAGVAATLLLSGLTMVWLSPSGCACSPLLYVGVSDLVRAYPGLSVGLVTVTAGGGEVRTKASTR